ncbi:MAG: tRNA (guanosine(46)-N7)-methyltransferase TrmB [Pseudomonadota bacterium]
MPPDHPTRTTEAFFGRRKGKALRHAQTEAMRELLPRLRVNVEAKAPARIGGIFTRDYTDYRLEIGFGGAEHLLAEARANPDIGFIGVEPFVNGLAKCVRALHDNPLPNIRLYDDDATVLLDWLPAASVGRIDLLYPDPWPKKKHWKRRFVSHVNLTRMARVLRPGGLFCFASDIDTYVNWTLLHCRGHSQFEWLAKNADNWRKPFAGWSGTRYESKALREGRTPAYLSFRRL